MEGYTMPRRKWTANEKMEIVIEGMAPGACIAEICRKHKIAQPQFYQWREAFLSGGLAGLTTGGASSREKELEEQLRDAQAKIGEQSLQIDILKKKTNWGRK
jgi:transposase